MKIRLGLLALAAAAAITFPATAQDWPSRQITITVVTGAGGSPDSVGRLIASKLTERLGQPVVVENNTAGAGIAGTLAVARSEPDGHNIVILTGGTPSQKVLREQSETPPYDLVEDLAKVTMLVAYPMVVSVPPESPIKDFADLIERAKAEPGAITHTMNSIGSLHHLLGEWIDIEAGIEMQGVSYRGAPPAFMDLTSGRVDVMIETATFSVPRIEQGQLRALAQSAPGQYALAPEIPAINETLPGIEMMSWLGFAMAKDTPKEIIDRLNAEVHAVLEMDDVKQTLTDMGVVPYPTTPEEMQEQIKNEVARWTRVIETKGIKAE